MDQKELVEVFERVDTYCLHLEIASYVAPLTLAFSLVLTIEAEAVARASRAEGKCPTYGCARDVAQDAERTRE